MNEPSIMTCANNLSTPKRETVGSPPVLGPLRPSGEFQSSLGYTMCSKSTWAESNIISHTDIQKEMPMYVTGIDELEDGMQSEAHQVYDQLYVSTQVRFLKYPSSI